MYSFVFFYFYLLFQTFDQASFDMERRANINGQTTKSTATIYFDVTGNMVTRFAAPLNVYIFNNEDGEIKIYNENDNTVVQSVNYKAGTANTNFYYFLKGEIEDMGLRKLGFLLHETKFDDGLLVTNWEAPIDMRENFASVELVHQGDVPVFLGHKDARGKFTKKIYYSDYQLLNDFIMFPKAITEIEYIKKDSLITKTKFSNFEFDGYVDGQYFDYEIPSDAKVME